MNNENAKEFVSIYSNKFELIIYKYDLVRPSENEISDKLGGLSHLRAKFNTRGAFDFMLIEMGRVIMHTRFAIANVLLFRDAGLTKFQYVESEHGTFGFLGTWMVTDARFFYFVDNVFSRLYGYWNRIAHFLNLFFKLIDDERRIYFAPFIDQLSTKVSRDKNYKSLKAFKESDYQDIINKKRKKIVHRETSSSTYFIDSIRHISDTQQLKKLQKERDELPDYFLKSFNRMTQGLDETIDLINSNIY